MGLFVLPCFWGLDGLELSHGGKYLIAIYRICRQGPRILSPSPCPTIT